MKAEVSRKEFLAGGALALAGCRCPAFGPTGDRSDYGGVRIGTITYSFRSLKGDALGTLGYAVRAGLGSVELMGYTAETFARIADPLPKDAAARAVALKARLAVPDATWTELRRRYEDAGVAIRIVKFGAIGEEGVSAEENDYYCRVAHLLGASAVTREIPIRTDYRPAPQEAADARVFGEVARNCAAVAERNGIDIAFHNHMQINALTYDSELLGYSKRLRINFDIGHYVAANDDDPLAFVRKYADRIVSIHIKDRTTTAHGQRNLPFGTGDTPLKGLFAYLRETQAGIPCDIELEYDIPAGSDAVREVGICNRYCGNLIAQL